MKYIFFDNIYILCFSGNVKKLKTTVYKIGICCFSTKHAALRRKNKDFLGQNQNNVFEWSDMST